MKSTPTHINIVLGFEDAAARDAFDAEYGRRYWTKPLVLEFAGKTFHFRPAMCRNTQRHNEPVFIIGGVERVYE